MKKPAQFRAALIALAALVALSSASMAESFDFAPVGPVDAALLTTRSGNAANVAMPVASEGQEEEKFKKHRSQKRENYPNLSDEEFANFRVVATTGMGKNALYRSSSPVDPSLARNRYADSAVKAAGIRTALNLADTKREMRAFPGYADSWYSRLDVVTLHMNPNYRTKSFRRGFAKGLRFLISHDGPYLLHCTMGRDRTGLTCAVLECLMGASIDEVIDDYMLSYYNYYGMVPGTDIYDHYLKTTLETELAGALRVESVTAEDVDLAARARRYLRRLGLTDEEIAALKDRLGRDYP